MIEEAPRCKGHNARIFLILGSLNAMLAVLLGAFGAHGLKAKIAPELLAVYQTAVQYHFYHALGLLLVGLIIFRCPSSLWFRSSGWLMIAGIVLFSGSLYILSITRISGFGAITPIGGMAFILAWLALTIGICRH